MAASFSFSNNVRRKILTQRTVNGGQNAQEGGTKCAEMAFFDI